MPPVEFVIGTLFLSFGLARNGAEFVFIVIGLIMIKGSL
jgi:hypothetical protein